MGDVKAQILDIHKLFLQSRFTTAGLLASLWLGPCIQFEAMDGSYGESTVAIRCWWLLQVADKYLTLQLGIEWTVKLT